MKRNHKILTAVLASFALAIFFFFGTKEKSTQIYGEIINPINDTIRIYNNDTIFTFVLDKENKFDYKFMAHVMALLMLPYLMETNMQSKEYKQWQEDRMKKFN